MVTVVTVFAAHFVAHFVSHAVQGVHGVKGFTVKDGLLRRLQRGIKSLGGVALFLHFVVMDCFACLHLVNAFGRCQCGESGTVRMDHFGRRGLHAQCERDPSRFLSAFELQLALELAISLGMLVGHHGVLFLHAFGTRAVLLSHGCCLCHGRA